MNISRRLFLSGAALLGGGIALDRLRQARTSVAEQNDVPDVSNINSVPDGATPTLVVMSTEPTLELFGPQEVVVVAAGESHSLALTRSGEVMGWGNNTNGQCSVPGGLTNVIQVVAGNEYSVALTRNGEVVTWGIRMNVDVTGPRDVVAVAFGEYYVLGLTQNGEVVALYGDVPSGLRNVVAIATGHSHALALTGSGEVIAWGENSVGQTDVPVGLHNVVEIAAGGYGASHSLALTSDGEVVAWGDNDYGQTDVPMWLRDVVAVAAGAMHSLAVKNNGEVVAWGDNTYGQCNVPLGLSDVVAVAAGSGHSLAVTRSGEVVAWGWNEARQCDVPAEIRAPNLSLGNNTTSTGNGVNGIILDNRSVDVPTGRGDDGRFYVGNADAPVEVIMYTDYQSPGCAYYTNNFKSNFEKEFVATGKVRMILHDFPLGMHLNAVKAAVAARCAGRFSSDAYWQMHDMLCLNQRQWSDIGGESVNAQFVTYAAQLSIDTTAFNGCLAESGETDTVLEFKRAANALGIPGTPVFAVNGKVVDASSAQTIEDIDALVRQAVGALLQ